MTKTPLQCNRKIMIFSINGAGSFGYPQRKKKIKLNPCPSPHTIHKNQLHLDYKSKYEM